MRTRRRALAALAAIGATCASVAAAQGVDRSRPPVVDASTGGFTIRPIAGPVVADGRQWLTVNPILGGKAFAAPNGQYTVGLGDANDAGDIARYRVTFTARDGKSVSLGPDPAAFAFVTGDSRWILLEPLDAIDVTNWRRYQLGGKFGIAAYTTLRAVSPDGQRLVIERSDCAFDCPQQPHQYYELGFPAAAAPAAQQPQAPAVVVSFADTALRHRAQLSPKPCALPARLATNQAYTVTSGLRSWSATVQDTNAAVVPYDQAQACIQLRGPGKIAGVTLGAFRTLQVAWLSESLLLLKLDLGHVAQAYELLDVENLKVLYARTEFYSNQETPRR